MASPPRLLKNWQRHSSTAGPSRARRYDHTYIYICVGPRPRRGISSKTGKAFFHCWPFSRAPIRSYTNVYLYIYIPVTILALKKKRHGTDYPDEQLALELNIRGNARVSPGQPAQWHKRWSGIDPEGFSRLSPPPWRYPGVTSCPHRTTLSSLGGGESRGLMNPQGTPDVFIGQTTMKKSEDFVAPSIIPWTAHGSCAFFKRTPPCGYTAQ